MQHKQIFVLSSSMKLGRGLDLGAMVNFTKIKKLSLKLPAVQKNNRMYCIFCKIIFILNTFTHLTVILKRDLYTGKFDNHIIILRVYLPNSVLLRKSS